MRNSIPFGHRKSFGGFPSLLRSMILSIPLLLAGNVSAAPVVQYSQDGTNYQPIVLLSSTMKAATYYDYRSHAGHPGFGVAKGVDTVCLYWDTTHDELSLIFISGGHDHDRASGNVSVKGLPSASQLTLSDDPGEFKYARRTGTLTGHFAYQNSTDGFVMSGLETASFDATLKLSHSSGIKSLRLTAGDPISGGAFIPLNLRQPLYLRTTVSALPGVGTPGPGIPVVGAGVPEPSGLGLIGMVAAFLIKRPRRAA